jgi:hypothetical protein
MRARALCPSHSQSIVAPPTLMPPVHPTGLHRCRLDCSLQIGAIEPLEARKPVASNQHLVPDSHRVSVDHAILGNVVSIVHQVCDQNRGVIRQTPADVQIDETYKAGTKLHRICAAYAHGESHNAVADVGLVFWIHIIHHGLPGLCCAVLDPQSFNRPASSLAAPSDSFSVFATRRTAARKSSPCCGRRNSQSGGPLSAPARTHIHRL